MRAEFFTPRDGTFATVEELQAALDGWASEDNTALAAPVLRRLTACRAVPARGPVRHRRRQLRRGVRAGAW